MNDKPDSGLSFVHELREAAARNPVSAALIGMGVLWMLTGAKSPSGAANAIRRTGLDHIPKALDDVRSSLSESAASVGDAATSALDNVRERGVSALENIADYRREMPDPGAVFDAARANLTELFRTQPLALGAIGLAIGAGIAAALPRTETEDAYLGEVSQTIKTKAVEVAGQQVETVASVASDVIDAASAEARKQGLTTDSAKAAVADLTGRVGRVMDAAKSSGRAD